MAPDGATKVTKHYAMGRLSFELGDVMPDRKTVYFGDDGDDVIRAMFVADKPSDLSAGTLYAARWMQTDGNNFGVGRSSQWIRLGHASDAEIKALIDKGIKFSDIWEIGSRAGRQGRAASTRTSSRSTSIAGTGGKTRSSHIYKLKPAWSKAAAFLETRRYAAYARRHERVHQDGRPGPQRGRQEALHGHQLHPHRHDRRSERRPAARRHPARRRRKGSHLRGGLREHARRRTEGHGGPADRQRLGRDRHQGAGARRARKPADAKVGRHDKCDTEKVANPDNVRYSEAMRTLFIGEDSGNHLNNFTWAFNVDTKALVRIFTAPAGGENTGLGVYDNVNGHAYITANVQHPGAKADLRGYAAEVNGSLRRLVDERGIVGYIGGLPAMTR